MIIVKTELPDTKFQANMIETLNEYSTATNYNPNQVQTQAGKLTLARWPMRVKIWSGEWKTGLGEWNFV